MMDKISSYFTQSFALTSDDNELSINNNFEIDKRTHLQDPITPSIIIFRMLRKLSKILKNI